MAAMFEKMVTTSYELSVTSAGNDQHFGDINGSLGTATIYPQYSGALLGVMWDAIGYDNLNQVKGALDFGSFAFFGLDASGSIISWIESPDPLLTPITNKGLMIVPARSFVPLNVGNLNGVQANALSMQFTASLSAGPPADKVGVTIYWYFGNSSQYE